MDERNKRDTQNRTRKGISEKTWERSKRKQLAESWRRSGRKKKRPAGKEMRAGRCGKHEKSAGKEEHCDAKEEKTTTLDRITKERGQLPQRVGVQKRDVGRRRPGGELQN